MARSVQQMSEKSETFWMPDDALDFAALVEAMARTHMEFSATGSRAPNGDRYVVVVKWTVPWNN
jgi:hypothetical protein